VWKYGRDPISGRWD